MGENFILKPNKGAMHKKKRLGAGPGSGLGSTCGRGHDGQRSRSGQNRPYVGFEGGQMPLYRRIPKRGFNRMRADEIYFNINDLNRFDEGAAFNIEFLLKNHQVKDPQTQLVILGNGEITKKMMVRAHRVSATAKEKIEKAGGTVEIVEG